MAINFPSTPTDGDTYSVNDIVYEYDGITGAWVIQANLLTGLNVNGPITANTINLTQGIIIAGVMNVVPTITASFNQANLAFNQANLAFAKANTGGSGNGGASVVTSNTAPVAPSDGDLWWHTDLCKMFIYYTDDDSDQWVETSPGYVFSDSDFIAVQSFAQANAAYAQANTARNHANAAFETANNAAGAVGGGNDKIFWENDSVVTANYSITAGRNAGTFGPITINANVVVTIPSNSVWSVV